MSKPRSIERMAACNLVLATFTKDTVMSIVSGRPAFSWSTTHGRITKVWVTRGSDFHPNWTPRPPWGGTQSTAISQLVRWYRDQPVLPMASWIYWASDTVSLCGPCTVETLISVGYPAVTPCVLCGNPPGGLDWWDLDNVTGPCCSYSKGCRQCRAL